MALDPIAEDSMGHQLFVENNEVGGRRYWSNEIGGGVLVWDTCLVGEEMLVLAVEAETKLVIKQLKEKLRGE